MRTIIAGSRDAESPSRLVAMAMSDAAFFSLIVPTVVVSGRARGIDTAGEQWAQAHGVPLDLHPVTAADWRRYGPSAGHLRNQRMAENADALVAVWDGQSRGTRNMIETARRRGLVIHIHYCVSADFLA